jgi:hypothetical protein
LDALKGIHTTRFAKRTRDAALRLIHLEANKFKCFNHNRGPIGGNDNIVPIDEDPIPDFLALQPQAAHDGSHAKTPEAKSFDGKAQS